MTVIATSRPSPGRAAVSPPSKRELFVAFLLVGVSGFGGVLPFVHRMLVEERRWLSEDEFIDVLSLCQFLPGPNIINIAIVVGRRFQGALGAAAATIGIMLVPFTIIVLLGAMLERFGHAAHVRETLAGIAAVASGLIVAMGLKIARPLRASYWQVGIAGAGFVAVAFLRFPLPWVVLGLVPVSVALAWRERTR
jgi:chromate transporter